MNATAQTNRRSRRFMPAWLTALFAAVLLVPAAIAVAGSVTTAVVDTTSPEGSVTLNAGQTSPVTIEATVQGAVDGTASFQVYRDWTLRNGTFEGSNPTTFIVAPRTGGAPANAYSVAGTVTIAGGEPEGSYNLQVAAMNITNSNQTGAKLGGGNSATYTITVNRPQTPPEPPQPPADATPPAFLSMPSDTTLEAEGPQGAAMAFSASASDATDGSVPVSFWIGSQEIFSPRTFPLGDTIVTLKAADKAGNLAEATFTVRVVDTTAPSVAAPTDLMREASGPKTTINLGGASASDLVDPSPQLSYWYNGEEISGSIDLPLGEHQLTVKAKDASGNTGEATWNVTLVDTTPPALSLPSDKTLEATGQQTPVALEGASAQDLVDPNPQLSYWMDGRQLSGSEALPLGRHAIQVKATDASGNESQGTWHVTIVDTTPPALSLPSDMATEATSGRGAMVGLAGASAQDLVDGSLPVTYWLGSQQLSSPAQLPLGENTITVRAGDKSGNSSAGSYRISILYNVSGGFLQPINYTGPQSWFKAGSTIPVKFQLPWSGGYISDAVATFSAAKVTNNLGTVNETAVTIAASSGTQFRYDTSSNQYIYNWSTKGLTAGEYRIKAELNGGQIITVKIGLR